MATFRRHGAKLLSIGDGHGNLVMAISQFKELRNATKAVISAQNDTIDDLIKWSAHDTNNDNYAIQDIVEKFGELFSMWIESQRQFANDLKEVRKHFEMILEGERIVDTASKIVESTETTETKLKKERKKLIRKSTPPINELEMIEERIAKIQLDKVQAASEFSSKQKDQKNLKSKRLKEALKKFSNGQLTLCKKGQILFDAGNDIIDHIPEMVLQDKNELEYSGSASTTQILIRTKEKLKNFNSENEKLYHETSSTDQTKSSPVLPILPPAYDKLDIQQPPVNPYYRPSLNLSSHENYDRTSTIPNASTRSSNLDFSSSYSSRNLYPDLSNNRRIYDYKNNFY